MLKDQLKEDLKAALKAGDTQRRTVIGTIMSVVKNRELEKRGKLMKDGADAATVEAQSALNDEEIVEAIQSEIKKRKESIETYTQGGRPELAEAEKAELDILMHYMPEQMSEEAIRVEVKQVIAAVNPQGPKDMGKVIGQVMPKVKGRADGTVVSRIVKEEMGA